MSKVHRETVQCPQCGKEVEVTLWDSLNGKLDPEAKRELLDGKLFIFTCPHCGYQTRLDYSLLYNDMAHSVMVHLVPEESVESTKAMLDELEARLGFAMPDCRKRIVTDQNALREKAIIFDNALDDRIIELIKYIYLAQALQRYPDAQIDAVYFLIADDKFILQFIGDTPLSIEFSSDLYDSVATEFADMITQENDKEVTIDRDWARQVFQTQH